MRRAGAPAGLVEIRTSLPSRSVSVTIGQSKPSSLGLNALLDFKAEVTLDGEPLTDAEWQTIVSSTDGLVFLRGKWVESDPEKLREVLAHWKKIERARRGGGFVCRGVSFAGRDQPGWRRTAGGGWRRVVVCPRRRLDREPTGGIARPAGSADWRSRRILAELRPYQHSGLHWLRFMARLGLGACLADDMGLGKTVQVLAALQHWRAESPGAPPHCWSPRPRCWPIGRRGRKIRARSPLPDRPPVGRGGDWFDQKETLEKRSPPQYLVVTTYGMLARRRRCAGPWNLAILDEAQAIKNPGTRQTRAVKELPRPARRAHRHAGREPPRRSVVHLRFSQSRACWVRRAAFHALRPSVKPREPPDLRPAAPAHAALHLAPAQDRPHASSPTCRTRPRCAPGAR